MHFSNCLFIAIALFACNRKVPPEAPLTSADSSLTAKNVAVVLQKTPVCIEQKIDSIKKEPVWNPPAEIYEYEYQGKKVYAISSNCCDFFNTVVDANCKYVCAPSGGFTGRGDGKCNDFFKEAKQVRLVWKDERKRK
ncbi:MAG: DUF6970 domain-containing protein [Segetibacter sp.]